MRLDEAFLPVPGFPDYEVSRYGNVRSWTPKKKGALLKPGLTSAGYPSVVLGGNTKLVHRLVAEVFIGPCPNGQEVRHKDGMRDNSHLDNLEYGTRRDNVLDMMRHGTYDSGKRLEHFGYASDF